MRRHWLSRIPCLALPALLLGGAVRTGAAESETSATAGSRAGGPGTAQANARYVGDTGLARTDSRSGRVNLARAVAVGVDPGGLSLSVSHALQAGHGPALASTFHLTIDRDGDVAAGGGLAVAAGPLERQASAGGVARTGPAPVAVVHSGGRTDPLGRVQARTWSDSRSFPGRPASALPLRCADPTAAAKAPGRLPGGIGSAPPGANRPLRGHRIRPGPEYWRQDRRP